MRDFLVMHYYLWGCVARYMRSEFRKSASWYTYELIFFLPLTLFTAVSYTFLILKIMWFRPREHRVKAAAHWYTLYR